MSGNLQDNRRGKGCLCRGNSICKEGMRRDPGPAIEINTFHVAGAQKFEVVETNDAGLWAVTLVLLSGPLN